MATPIAITRQKSLFGNNSLTGIDSERFDALERAGFRVDRFGDLWKLLSERLGGHYMDVGCSAKIAAGLVCSLPLCSLFNFVTNDMDRCRSKLKEIRCSPVSLLRVSGSLMAAPLMLMLLFSVLDLSTTYEKKLPSLWARQLETGWKTIGSWTMKESSVEPTSE